MNKPELIRLIGDKSNGGVIEIEKVIGWVGALPGTNKPENPTENKVGDVYMHPIFLHPCILLEKSNDSWICGLFTSEPTCSELFCETKSRFFSTSYFTTALFTIQEPNGTFMGVYDNDRHLKSVLKKLRKTLA